MTRKTMKTRLIAAAGAALIALGGSGAAWSEHDHDDDGARRGTHEGRGEQSRGRLAPVTNDRYRTECGGCHFAFQPGLLPAAAWGQIMGTLDKHFGDDATLDPAVTAQLLAYLQAGAAERGAAARPVAAQAAGETPPRITQTAFFLNKHDEVPARYVKGNAKVGSFSNCLACHPGAEKADFDEDQVNIPGVGRFED
jgi:hypothetical protein